MTSTQTSHTPRSRNLTPFLVPPAETVVELRHPSYGRNPSGKDKLHVEMFPEQLVRFLGYDPRALKAPKSATGKDKTPGNVPDMVVSLQREVQRSVDASRVAEMVEYLRAAASDGARADWAELTAVTCARPDMDEFESRAIVKMPASAAYFLTDGQHRFCALIDFVKQYPRLARQFTQALAVTIVDEDELAEYAGQVFHDMNYLQMPVKAAKALHADTRDAFNRLAKELHEHPVFLEGGGIAFDRDTVAAKAKEFTTHSVVFKFARGFVEGRKGLDRGNIPSEYLAKNYDRLKSELWDYVTLLGTRLPSWTMEPGADRALFMTRTSSAMQALAVLGWGLYTQVDDEAKRLRMLDQVDEAHLDWRRTNLNWSGVLGIPKPASKDKEGNTIPEMVQPASARQYIDNTLKLLRDKSGLTAHEAQRKAREAMAGEEDSE
jgi:DGQHR domain-containing protein